MKADTDRAYKGNDRRLRPALRSEVGAADIDAAQKAAASAVADWHREAQEREQRQFSVYMSKKRYVIPEGGLKSVPRSPVIKQQDLVSLPSDVTNKSNGALATIATLPSAGKLLMRSVSQHQHHR